MKMKNKQLNDIELDKTKIKELLDKEKIKSNDLIIEKETMKLSIENLTKEINHLTNELNDTNNKLYVSTNSISTMQINYDDKFKLINEKLIDINSEKSIIDDL